MWLFVFFDLPTETKLERKAASTLRTDLLTDGFFMFQYSIYIRNCSSRENALVHSKRVKNMLPKNGKVSILKITDKQFGMMDNFYGRKQEEPPDSSEQLEFF